MTYVSTEMTFFKKNWKEARWPLPQGENRGHRREKNKINKKKKYIVQGRQYTAVNG